MIDAARVDATVAAVLIAGAVRTLASTNPKSSAKEKTHEISMHAPPGLSALATLCAVMALAQEAAVITGKTAHLVVPYAVGSPNTPRVQRRSFST